jgi:hypothetical protein
MAVCFAQDIRPLFTEMDITHLRNLGVLPDNFDDMRNSSHVQNVLNNVSTGAMTASRKQRAFMVTRKRPSSFEIGLPPDISCPALVVPSQIGVRGGANGSVLAIACRSWAFLSGDNQHRGRKGAVSPMDWMVLP